MNEPCVAIHMAVHNGAKWLPWVLDSVAAQTYTHTTVTLWDNASTDETIAIASRYPNVTVLPHTDHVSFWTAQEKMLEGCTTEYVVALTDVILDPQCIARSVATLEGDSKIGAIQVKIMAMDWKNGIPEKSNRIDALGFQLERSRRVTILGHGQEDRGQFDHIRDIFGVEGAVPIFRRTALEACRVQGHVVDPDYRVGTIGYGDDFDLAWRMTLFGWRQVLVPTALAWHDRSTTKNVLSTGLLAQHVQRRMIRQKIPIAKRRLEWSNVRFTIIKNDYIVNILRDLPAIIAREINVQGYAGLFEQGVLLEWGRFLRFLPRMLVKRWISMASAKRNADQMRALMVGDVTVQATAPASEPVWHLLRAMVVVLVVALLFFIVRYFAHFL